MFSNRFLIDLLTSTNNVCNEEVETCSMSQDWSKLGKDQYNIMGVVENRHTYLSFIS